MRAINKRLHFNHAVFNFETNCKTLLDHDVELKAEFEHLIKILDENNDPTTHIIKESLIAGYRIMKNKL